MREVCSILAFVVKDLFSLKNKNKRDAAAAYRSSQRAPKFLGHLPVYNRRIRSIQRTRYFRFAAEQRFP
jgi:hypothetical protein